MGGGVDFHGSHLFTIHAHGSASKVPYTAMGSGSLAAMAVLEECWKEGLQEEEAKKLVRGAIAAGIINDMGSGSSIDLAVIKPYEKLIPKGERKGVYKYPKGTTAVLSTNTYE